MYLIAILGVILSAFLMASSAGAGMELWRNYIDLTSLVLVLVIAFPTLIAAGLFRDFNGAFRIALEKNNNKSLTEMKRALEAVELFMKSVLYAGIFTFLFTCIIILRMLVDLAYVGPNLSVALLTLIYAMVINLVLMPVRYRIKVKIIEFMK